MYAKVLMIIQAFQHGIRDGANTHLQGTPVFNQISDQYLPIFILPFRYLFPKIGFLHRLFAIYHGMKAAGMYQPVAMRTRSIGIHLCNDQFGCIHSTAGNVNRYTQGTIPMCIGHGYLHNGYIDRQDILLEQFRDLTKENGNIIGTALCIQPAG